MGDRLGQLAQLATIGRLLNLTVVTRWDQETRWGREYPENIHQYLRFPDSLRFVRDAAAAPRTQLRNTGPSFRAGFDFVPEASHYYLVRDRILPRATPWASYAAAYRDVASQFRATARVHARIPREPFVAVHLRRGDRGGEPRPPDDLLRHLSPDERHVVVSDSREARRRLCATIRCVPLPPVPRRERALRDFIALTRATEIVQSQPTFPGWSSFSFVAASLSDVPLVTCSHPARLADIRHHCRRNVSGTRACSPRQGVVARTRGARPPRR